MFSLEYVKSLVSRNWIQKTRIGRVFEGGGEIISKYLAGLIVDVHNI